MGHFSNTADDINLESYNSEGFMNRSPSSKKERIQKKIKNKNNERVKSDWKLVKRYYFLMG